MPTTLLALENLIKEALAQSTPDARYAIRRTGVRLDGLDSEYFELRDVSIKKRKIVENGEEKLVSVLVLDIQLGFDHILWAKEESKHG